MVVPIFSASGSVMIIERADRRSTMNTGQDILGVAAVPLTQAGILGEFIIHIAVFFGEFQTVSNTPFTHFLPAFLRLNSAEYDHNNDDYKNKYWKELFQLGRSLKEISFFLL